ncbi:hypothetical protein MHBO_001892 [Bonamia ostreae]
MDKLKITVIAGDPPKLEKQVKSTAFSKIKILSLNNLKENYYTLKQKRDLRRETNLFLADRKVLNRLPKLLGSTFIKQKKMPLPIKIGSEKAVEKIENAKNSTLLYLSGSSCCQIKVAKTDFQTLQIKENTKKVLTFLENGKIGKILSICLKTTESISLPLFSQLPETDENDAPTFQIRKISKIDNIINDFKENGDNFIFE